jgi:hypothetical protein
MTPDLQPRPETDATRRERTEFLRSALAFAEAGIRSFDAKAQIALAAFVLSFGPLLSIIRDIAGNSAKPLLAGCGSLYVVAIVCCLHVLWPIAGQAGVAQRKSAFHPRPDDRLDAAAYRERVDAMDTENELVHEVLALTRIRSIEGRRFRVAVLTAGVFYAACLLSIDVSPSR